MMVKKLILFICITFSLTGCSLLKIASAPLKSTKTTVPQQIEKSTKQMKCKGNIEIQKNGNIYCSDGFYLYESASSQKERRMNLRERVAQFVTNASGYLLWAVIISIILTMCGLGAIVSAFWSATFSVGSKALKQVVTAVQRAKTNNQKLVEELEKTTDTDVRKFITEYKLKNNIE